MPIAKLVELGFSTADAEFPEIRMVDSDLRLRFRDWQEKVVDVSFNSAIAFKWQVVEMFLSGERDDSCYEILDSDWLQLHRSQGAVEGSDQYVHYKLNFNSIGQLEVLALRFSVATK